MADKVINGNLEVNGIIRSLDNLPKTNIFNSIEGGSNGQSDVYYQSLIFVPFPEKQVGDSVEVKLSLLLDGVFNLFSYITWVDSVWSTSGGEVNVNTVVLNSENIVTAANNYEWFNMTFTATVRNFTALRINNQYSIIDTSTYGKGVYVMIVNKSLHALQYRLTEIKDWEFLNIPNLKNGIGTDSLVQIYTGELDSTHFGNTNTGDSSVVFGEANSNTSTRALVSGKMNRNTGSNNIIAGLGNGRGIGAEPTIGVIGGNNNIVAGAQNANSSATSSIVSGQQNTNSGSYSIIAGTNNVNNNERSLVIGTNNRNNTNNAIIAGQFNEPKTNSFFIVGNGTADDSRSNAFVVYNDGHAEVGLGPTNAMDVATKQYVDALGTTIEGSISTLITTTEYGGQGGTQADPYQQHLIKLPALYFNDTQEVYVEMDVYIDGTVNAYSSLVAVKDVYSVAGGEAKTTQTILSAADLVANQNKWVHVGFTAYVATFEHLRKGSQYPIVDFDNTCGVYILETNKDTTKGLKLSNIKISLPKPSSSGELTLKCVNGIMQWVSA